MVFSIKRTPRKQRVFVLETSLALRPAFTSQAMDQLMVYVKPVKDFAKDSMRLVKRCTKPDMKGEAREGRN